MSDEQHGPYSDLLLLHDSTGEVREALRKRAREMGSRLDAVPLTRPGGADGVDPGRELRNAGEALALCQALVEGTRDEVLVADEGGRITLSSPRLASLAGLEPGDAAGRPADRILGAIGLPNFEDLRGLLSRVTCARTEAELVDPAGETRPVLLRGVSTRLFDQRLRFVWFITELTRVRSVERANRILQSELETQSRVLALVSHELRTPLNVILGQLSLLQTGLRGELTAEQRDSIERSERASQSLLSLINDLIDFSRMEADELAVETRSFPVDELLTEVLDVTGSLREERKLSIEVVPGPDGEPPTTVLADPERTRQILIKLLTNAIKFSEEGTIRLKTREVARPEDEPGDLEGDRRYLALEVRDPGVGIAADEMERIFEPFQQSSPVLRRSRGGTGLGLTIARGLARRQNGDLVARSDEDRGTVFTLYLPLPEA